MPELYHYHFSTTFFIFPLRIHLYKLVWHVSVVRVILPFLSSHIYCLFYQVGLSVVVITDGT